MVKEMKEMKHCQIGLNFREEILHCLKQDLEGLVLEEAQPEVYPGQSHRTVVKLIKRRIWILINLINKTHKNQCQEILRAESLKGKR